MKYIESYILLYDLVINVMLEEVCVDHIFRIYR